MSENEAPIIEESTMAKIAEDPKQPPVAAEPVVVDAPVGDYPERPYSEAISDEHRAALKDAGFEV